MSSEIKIWNETTYRFMQINFMRLVLQMLCLILYHSINRYKGWTEECESITKEITKFKKEYSL